MKSFATTKNFGAKHFIYCFFIGANCVSSASSGIRELPLNEKYRLKYDQSEFVVKYKLNIQKTFIWTVGHNQGILLTAQPSDPQGSMECLVLSWKNGRMKLVGGSQSLHGCKWLKTPPAYFVRGSQEILRFFNKVDVSGYEIDYSPTFIEILFDKKNKEFCTMDYFSSLTPKCMVF